MVISVKLVEVFKRLVLSPLPFKYWSHLQHFFSLTFSLKPKWSLKALSSFPLLAEPITASTYSPSTSTPPISASNTASQTAIPSISMPNLPTITNLSSLSQREPGCLPFIWPDPDFPSPSCCIPSPEASSTTDPSSRTPSFTSSQLTNSPIDFSRAGLLSTPQSSMMARRRKQPDWLHPGPLITVRPFLSPASS